MAKIVRETLWFLVITNRRVKKHSRAEMMMTKLNL